MTDPVWFPSTHVALQYFNNEQWEAKRYDSVLAKSEHAAVQVCIDYRRGRDGTASLTDQADFSLTIRSPAASALVFFAVPCVATAALRVAGRHRNAFLTLERAKY